MRRLAPTLAALAALAVAGPAPAATRDFDSGFGDDGVALTPVGDTGWANAVARQPDGKLVAVGGAVFASPDGQTYGNAIARYLPSGALDTSFGGGDGIVLDAFDIEGSDARVVAIQSDGKIVVAGSGACCFARVVVARYLPSGAHDLSFGDDGFRSLGVGADHADVGGIAFQPDGKILVAGSIFGDGSGQQDNTGDIFVARLTSSGARDPSYAGGPSLSDAVPPYSEANGLVVQDGKAIIAGAASTGPYQGRVVGIGLARLTETGTLDQSFGTNGVVMDRPTDDGVWRATDLALSNGKLVVSGEHSFRDAGTFKRDYVLARYDADGGVDDTLDPDGPLPGHVVAHVGSDHNSGAAALAVDKASGTMTLTGTAYDNGIQKLLIDSFAADGTRDPEFVSANGNIGPRLVAAGDGAQTYGTDLLLDARGGTIVSGAARDGDRVDFVLTRLGDLAPMPPVARISGQHRLPNRTWVRFDGLRSSDPDGRVVDYAWRIDRRRWQPVGAVFWHKFRVRGLHTIELRVTDDDGLRGYARFLVRTLKRGG
jgi:uncharacterized delta-60 repeat protein